MSDPTWYRRDGADWLLMLYLQPGARHTDACGLHDGALKIRLAAPPVEGKANAALIAWLAKLFEVPRKHVSIEQGELSRHKRVRITASRFDPPSVLPATQCKTI